MNCEIKPTSERKCTNIPPMIFCIVFLGITVILVASCAIIGSSVPKEVVEYRDSCGNICGKNNIGNSNECGDPDKSRKTKLLVSIMHDYDDSDEDESDEDDDKKSKDMIRRPTCVEECPEQTIDVDNQCLNIDLRGPGVIMKGLFSTFAMGIVAFVFSYVFLVLFRHVAKYVVWIIIGGSVAVLFIIAIAIFIIGDFLFGGIFLIIGIILAGIVISYQKKIEMVAKLFKETSKALMDVPSIMIEPVLTIISLFIGFIIFLTFLGLIETIEESGYDGLYIASHVFNGISFIWFTQFISGCQNFVVAGTITRWYFTHDKTKLEKPVRESFWHLTRFHLGSICFGAMLITIVKVLRAIARQGRNNNNSKTNPVVLIIIFLISCILALIEDLLEYIIRNAYIIMAKDGTPFIESGKSASRLLIDNISDVIALNTFGDFVLFMCRLLITLIAGIFGYSLLHKLNLEVEYFVVPLILGIVFSFLIANCFVSVFEMTVDTIFVCFCIDLDKNDGADRPYYMSESLKNLMVEMKGLSGGSFTFGPKEMANGAADGSAIPMLPGHKEPEVIGPVYPVLPPPYPGVHDPNQFPVAPYPGQYPPPTFSQATNEKLPYPPK